VEFETLRAAGTFSTMPHIHWGSPGSGISRA
jgi:hypothetical protein